MTKAMDKLYWDEETGAVRNSPTRHGWHTELYRAKEVDVQITQLRGNLSLAEEGLANYALEVERLRGYWTGDKLTGGSDVCHTCHAHCVVLGDKDAEIERKNSLIDLQDEAQTSLHAENVRLRVENEQLQSRLEGSQAAAAVGEREIERLQAEMRSQHAAYQRMFDKAAELERRLNASEPGACAKCGFSKENHDNPDEFVPMESAPRGAGFGEGEA